MGHSREAQARTEHAESGTGAWPLGDDGVKGPGGRATSGFPEAQAECRRADSGAQGPDEAGTERTMAAVTPRAWRARYEEAAGGDEEVQQAMTGSFRAADVEQLCEEDRRHRAALSCPGQSSSSITSLLVCLGEEAVKEDVAEPCGGGPGWSRVCREHSQGASPGTGGRCGNPECKKGSAR